jgi:hypothetical protein
MAAMTAKMDLSRTARSLFDFFLVRLALKRVQKHKGRLP